MIRPLLIALALCALPLRAEEPAVPGSREPVDRPIYESIDGVVIGRVFLSPAERTRLDAARRGSPEQAERPATDVASAVTSTAAGYIRVGGKAPAVFRDGRFVRAGDRPLPEPETPGLIRRHDAGERREPAAEQ